MVLSDNVIYIGDIHGEFKTLIHLLKRYKIQDATLIQVGDFGVGFYKESRDKLDLVMLNSFLKKINCDLLAIRGNHDDPKFFDGSYDLSRLKLLPDYSVLTIGGLKHLFVGGAISVDRQFRIERDSKKNKKSYWVDEVFVLDEEKLIGLNDIDVVITHTAPDFCFPFMTEVFDANMNERFAEDPDLKLDIAMERNNCRRLFEILKNNGCKIKDHLYGHYHKSYRMDLDGCTHILLGINEFKQIYYNE